MRWTLGLLVVVLVTGCALPGPQAATPVTLPSIPSLPSVSPIPSLPIPPGPVFEPQFDGARAFEHVRAQVEDENQTPIYRIPGSPGNERVAKYIEETLVALNYSVTFHYFSAMYDCEMRSMHNVIAERAGTSGRTAASEASEDPDAAAAASRIVAFAAHYDTRPMADKDPDVDRRSEPVLGANDGGSGVGVLLELARVLPASNDTVRLLFFDGEDGGGVWNGCRTEWILGSRAYAQTLSEEEVARFDALVLVDMIGDPDLTIPREGHTAADERGASVQDDIYAVADLLEHSEFSDKRGAAILDDHVPFLERMIPAVDLIHTIPGDPQVFPAWHHTLSDDLSTVSAESLDAVGETLEAWFAAR